ncbi:UxaA family hydrolase [Paracoccus laeviglucosivorans]|uniref:Altronate hydrolase n=1 Tax=Paracoccus laeviglucosivorans TaxID=1197861 RepID=K7ZN67_9RHOB|nr:altronate dehydratase family protein [Paracoccus laeviglucosivorans]BAM68208.1 D-idonate dehydratase lgnE [Paracoccus laeviglucosivorans]SMO97257.1 altronate hydrolase [Paracoccus laeviglucosivorans]
MKAKTIRLHPDDDVVIALEPLAAGSHIETEALPVLEPIPAGHKIATRDIPANGPIRRYNQVIGLATQPVRAGQHVHVQNVMMADVENDYAVGVDALPTQFEETPATFMGIRRPDGRVATRNYIGIMTSVNCSARVARAIAEHFRRDLRPEALEDYPNIDGVVALTHGFGCGIDVKSEGMAIIRRTLSGYAVHPNFSAVIFVGLGCEANQIGDILASRGLSESATLHSYTIQDVGGTTNAVRQGIDLVKSMLPKLNDIKRESVPASYLTVGLQCGGSDGYSGISANPALGAAVDLLVKNGGTAILSETPEVYGAEHLLTRRAASAQVADKLISRIDWWKDYCAKNGAEMNNNPSAGNKAGGLTTILEKSLGAVAKAGTTNLMEVYEYAELVTEHGMVFMDSPGFDPISATGQVASGANLICFTTGRGSAFGCMPSPSLKLATNSATWRRQEDDMDIDCGVILEGSTTIEELGRVIFERMLSCASGQASKSELHGYGQDEFVPWQLAVVT